MCHFWSQFTLILARFRANKALLSSVCPRTLDRKAENLVGEDSKKFLKLTKLVQITANKNFHPNFFHAFPWLLKKFYKKEKTTQEKTLRFSSIKMTRKKPCKLVLKFNRALQWPVFPPEIKYWQ